MTFKQLNRDSFKDITFDLTWVFKLAWKGIKYLALVYNSRRRH